MIAQCVTLVVWVLLPDDVTVRVIHAQLPGRIGPVVAQQVADVGDAQVGAVERVELAVAGLPQEVVLALRLSRTCNVKAETMFFSSVRANSRKQRARITTHSAQPPPPLRWAPA